MIVIVMKFVTQTVAYIPFTIEATSLIVPLPLCMYMHRSTLVYFYIYIYMYVGVPVALEGACSHGETFVLRAN